LRDEDILSAARADRGHPELDELVARADNGERVTDEILDLLVADPALWEEFHKGATNVVATVRTTGSYVDLPGNSEPSAEIVYHCTACEYEHLVYEVGEPVPKWCQQCGSPLAEQA
jgi:hypothetical protein